MKEQLKQRSNVFGAIESRVQTISQAKLNKAVAILRDKLYTDKLKAAITEPLCNAIDEHRKHNVTRPVDVYITTDEIVIRDYAKGLDDETLFNVFFQYLNSTKNDTDEQIGGFGLGAKAPGAYAQVYSVVSYYNGKKTVFWSRVDGDSNIVSKVASEDTDQPSGIAVHIPWFYSAESDKESYKRELCNAFKLLHDLSVFVGYKRDIEFRVIHPSSIDNVMKYISNMGRYSWDKSRADDSVLNTYTDAILEASESEKIDATQISPCMLATRAAFMARTTAEYEELRERWNLNGRCPYSFGDSYISDERKSPRLKFLDSYYRNNMFSYKMFFGDQLYFYDGDMLYTTLEATPETERILELKAYLRGDRALFIRVDRQDICINQNRESVSIVGPNVDKVLNYIFDGLYDMCEDAETRLKKKISGYKKLDIFELYFDVLDHSALCEGAYLAMLRILEKFSSKLKKDDFKLLRTGLSGNPAQQLEKTLALLNDGKNGNLHIRKCDLGSVFRYSSVGYTDIHKAYEYDKTDYITYVESIQDVRKALRDNDCNWAAITGSGYTTERILLDREGYKILTEKNDLYNLIIEMGLTKCVEFPLDKDADDEIKRVLNNKLNKVYKRKNITKELDTLELKDFVTGTPIDSPMYSKTLLFTPTDINSSSGKDTLINLSNKLNDDLKSFVFYAFSKLGYEYTAKVNSKYINALVDKGCTRYSDAIDEKVLKLLDKTIIIKPGICRYPFKELNNSKEEETKLVKTLIPKGFDVFYGFIPFGFISSISLYEDNKHTGLVDRVKERSKRVNDMLDLLRREESKFIQTLTPNDLLALYIYADLSSIPLHIALDTDVGKEATRMLKDKREKLIRKYIKFISKFKITKF